MTRPCASRNTAAKTNPTKISMAFWLIALSPRARRNGKRLNRQLDAFLHQRSMERRNDAGSLQLTLYLAFSIDSSAFEREDLRHRDHIAFHAIDLLHADETSATVFLPLHLNHYVDCGGDLRAQRLQRKRDAGHRHHRLDPAQRVARCIRVDGRERSVVARVHRL